MRSAGGGGCRSNRCCRRARTSCSQPTVRTIADVGSRFISAVAFYGPKTGRLRELLAGVQALIAAQVGDDFLPYSLEPVHATLIALDAVRDGGAVINEYSLAHAGVRQEMNLPQVMDILARRFATPLRIRIGGFPPGQAAPLTSPGQP